MKNIFLIFLSVCLVACAYHRAPGRQLTYQWKDLTTCVLTRVWGQPDRTIILPNCHKILIYTKPPCTNCFMPAPIYLYRSPCGCLTTNSYHASQPYLASPCYIQVEANAKNEIVNVQTSGNCMMAMCDEHFPCYCGDVSYYW